MIANASMARLFAGLAASAFLVALEPTYAASQISPRTCGVLDGPGCNPYQCSILDGPGCLAQAQGGVGETLQLTLGTRATADSSKPSGELNTIRDLFAALRGCWTPPVPELAHRGMQMSIRFSLNRKGRLIGEPRVTYASREANQRTRDLYRDAIAQSLQACIPLLFTKSFAGAIAGRPIVIRIIENRDESTKPPV